ncbi:MAG: c-type cytochrome [Desulfovibrionaceae bacterium]|nr:c-type cytochrome [Desulfovibrionaceae bacterium]
MKDNWKHILAFVLGAFLLVAVQSKAAQEDYLDEGKKLYDLRCVGCHGKGAEKLAGKPMQYLADRMQAIKEMEDPLFENVRRMRDALAPLTDEQIKNIALYLHSLK